MLPDTLSKFLQLDENKKNYMNIIPGDQEKYT